MKKALLALLSAAMLVSLAGCGGTKTAAKKSAASGTADSNSIVYAMTTAPSGIFNPLLSDTSYDDAVNQVVYASLMMVNNKGNLEPYLAEKCDISSDQKVITYTLRSDVKWQDGKTVTADDVAFTFTSMCDADFTGGNSGDALYIKGAQAYHDKTADTVAGIQVVNDTTVKIVFDAPRASAVTMLGTSGILPQHIWKDVAIGKWDKETKLLNAPVGCGPYKLTDYKSGQYVKFTANKDFFLGKPKTSSLMFQVVNSDTLQAEFKSGDIDIANVSDLTKSDISGLKDMGLKIASYPNYMYQYVGLNMRLKVFQDDNLRHALMYAVNRQGMVDKLLEGRGKVVNVPMLPSGWAYPDESTLEKYSYNTAKAKELLAAAGWKDSNGDGVVENSDGKKLELTLICPTGSTIREQAALMVQENLKAVGIKVDIKSMEFSAVMEQVVANHDFDMYMMGNTLSLDPDPTPFWGSQAISNEKGVQGYNIVGYGNPEVDKLLAEGNATLDQTERAAIYAKYAKILNQAVPQIYLYCQDIENAYNAKLQGYEPSTYNEFYNVYNWTIAK
jgi:peptide/nickel transport system substrate-binding protein